MIASRAQIRVAILLLTFGVPLVTAVGRGQAPAAPQPPATATPQDPAKQDPAKPQDPAKAQDPAAAKPAATPNDKLEQLVAPIALYPDALLTQVLMASTYPVEVVEASRWQAVKKLTGTALEQELQKQTWDPSVKSLCGVPTVLQRLSDNLDWCTDLGDAFLADKAALMDVVQKMRRKALEAGNLKTTKEQTVTDREDKIIVITAASPEVVYVPTYYPTTVYGGWSYPVYYYPPIYAPPPPGYTMFAFAAGVAWGAAIWGGCSWGWGHSEVNINVNNYNKFVGKTEINARRTDLQKGAGNSNWQHQTEHRKGAQYRDTATAQKYSGANSGNRVSREQARGYSPNASQRTAAKGQPAAGNRSTAPTAKPSTGSRPTSSTTKPTTKPTTGQRSGSFSGANNASLDRAASQRGSASRSSSGGGASRSGGGGGGGGGGGRSGGGGGRR